MTEPAPIPDFQVTLHGEALDFHDDEAIRAHSVSHAIGLIKLLPNKRLRREFERFFAQVYFLMVKSGGVLAYHQLLDHQTVPIDEMDMIQTFLRAALGEGEPQVSRTEEKPLIEVPT